MQRFERFQYMTAEIFHLFQNRCNKQGWILVLVGVHYCQQTSEFIYNPPPLLYIELGYDIKPNSFAGVRSNAMLKQTQCSRLKKATATLWFYQESPDSPTTVWLQSMSMSSLCPLMYADLQGFLSIYCLANEAIYNSDKQKVKMQSEICKAWWWYDMLCTYTSV